MARSYFLQMEDIMKKFNVDQNGHPVGRKNPVVSKFPPSATIASHAKGLTVNEIMKRFSVTGTIPDRGVPGQFLDVTKMPSVFEALNMRVRLNKYFMGLDAVTRSRFANDPMKLVSFVNDPKNFQAGLDLGLLKLNAAGVKAKAVWDEKQASLAADKRKAFVADVQQILKEVPSDDK